MNKIKLGVLAFLLASGTTAFAKSVAFGADLWMPVNGNPGDKEPGFQVEIAKQVLSAAGYDINYTIYPWSRALELTRGGELNCVFGAARGDEPNFLSTAFPLGQTTANIFTRPDSKLELKDVQSLQSVKLGAITDYSYDKVIDAYIAEHKTELNRVQLISSNNPLEQNINKLINGRLDAVVEVKMVFDFKLKQMGIERDKVADKGSFTAPNPLFIACNKKSAAVIELLDAAIPKMQADGSLEKIIDKYGVQKWW